MFNYIFLDSFQNIILRLLYRIVVRYNTKVLIGMCTEKWNDYTLWELTYIKQISLGIVGFWKCVTAESRFSLRYYAQ